MKYLSRETDYIAWYSMFKALEYLSNVFLFSETNFENINIIHKYYKSSIMMLNILKLFKRTIKNVLIIIYINKIYIY